MGKARKHFEDWWRKNGNGLICSFGGEPRLIADRAFREGVNFANRTLNKVNGPDSKALPCEHMREGNFCKVVEDVV